ncbi:MAG: filamentous hemagglutinin N-terminal domain-containing protein, partial [Alphaproteobacteria bacterium]|nr:filamentous hemagglutinin N-terminal domain-containing protein [Alphaproteobacteria bacterium]
MNVYSRLIASTALTAALIHFQPISTAKAAPQGGAVVGGSATIGQSGNTTTINQSTQRAAINWQSFNVAANETVTFAVPNNGATLNRVVGNAASTIQGTVQSNGTLILVNPNGLVFDTGSKITAQNFVAATGDIGTSDFMGGYTPRFRATGDLVGNGKITLKGDITTADRGVVGIFAPQIVNSGKIAARLGSVTLAGGMGNFVIDFDGSGLMNFELSGHQAANLQRVAIENEGTISANGGQILMQANDASNLLNAVLSNSGELAIEQVSDASANATSVTPSISMLLYSDAGQFTNSGTIRNNAQNGSVVIRAQDINLSVSGNISVGTSAGATTRIYVGQGGQFDVYSMGNLNISSTGIYVGQGGKFKAFSKDNLDISSNMLLAGGSTTLSGHNVTANYNLVTQGDAELVIKSTRNVMFEGNLSLLGKYTSIEGDWIETKGAARFGGVNSFMTATKIDFLDDVLVTGGTHSLVASGDVRLTLPNNRFENLGGNFRVTAESGMIYSNARLIYGGNTSFSAKYIENNGFTAVTGGNVFMTATYDMFNYNDLNVLGGNVHLAAQNLDLYGNTRVSGGTLNLRAHYMIAELWESASTHVTGKGALTVYIGGYTPTSDQVVTNSGVLNYNILRNEGRNITINAREIHLNNFSLDSGLTIIRAGEFTTTPTNVPQTPSVTPTTPITPP